MFLRRSVSQSEATKKKRSPAKSTKGSFLLSKVMEVYYTININKTKSLIIDSRMSTFH